MLLINICFLNWNEQEAFLSEFPHSLKIYLESSCSKEYISIYRYQKIDIHEQRFSEWAKPDPKW